jgi:FlaA1/EpsC-like NDP-sugar epimerase
MTTTGCRGADVTAIPYEARAKTGSVPHPRHEQAPALPRQLEVAAPAVAEVTGARWLRAYSHLLLAGDAACALLAVLAGTVIRFGDADTTPLYVAMLVLFPLLWVSAMWLCRAYESRYLGAGSEEFKRVGNAGVRVLAAVATAAYAAHSEIARGYVLLVLPLATALTLLARGGARQYVQRERRLHRRFTHKAVVVGRPQAVLSLAGSLWSGRAWMPPATVCR